MLVFIKDFQTNLTNNVGQRSDKQLPRFDDEAILEAVPRVNAAIVANVTSCLAVIDKGVTAIKLLNGGVFESFEWTALLLLAMGHCE